MIELKQGFRCELSGDIGTHMCSPVLISAIMHDPEFAALAWNLLDQYERIHGSITEQLTTTEPEVIECVSDDCDECDNYCCENHPNYVYSNNGLDAETNAEILQAFEDLQKVASKQHRKKISSDEYKEKFITTVCGENNTND